MELERAFEIITGRVERLLLARGYKKQSVAPSEKELTALYTGEIAYSIVYYFDKKRVLLRSCSMEDGEPDNTWKTVATWLFDPETDTARDAENIAEDFAETIRGPKQTAVQKQKKNKKEGENTSDPLFFANRMVTYFPELRDEIAYEKAHYESFRGITFADEKIMPKFVEYVNFANKITTGLVIIFDDFMECLIKPHVVINPFLILHLMKKPPFSIHTCKRFCQFIRFSTIVRFLKLPEGRHDLGGVNIIINLRR